jgi:hypothetical protein
VKINFRKGSWVLLPALILFIAPQPYASWSLDDNFDWQPLAPMPEYGHYFWDEESLPWQLIV